MMNKYLLSALVPMVACYATYAGAETPQTQRVIVSGYGETVEAATKNAATAALEQVVGSFIDANTFLSKKKEISNGLVNQTKTISQNINNYSNGVIESLSVVGTEQNGALYKVTVDAVVRVTELKVVMDQIVGKAELNSQGLFAQVQTQLNQEKNIEQILLNNLIKPQQNGSAFEISLGKAYLLDNAPAEHFKFLKNFKANNQFATLIIPLEIKLKQDFLEKLQNTLAEISSDIHEDIGIKSRYNHINITNESLADQDLRYKLSDAMHGVAITIPQGDGTQFHGKFNKQNGNYYIKSINLKREISKLKVEIKNKQNQTILTNSFKTDGGGENTRGSSFGKISLVDLYNDNSYHYSPDYLYSTGNIYSPSNYCADFISFPITRSKFISLTLKKSYLIVLQLDPSRVNEAQQIEVLISQN